MSSGYYLTGSFYYLNLGAHMLYILRNRLQAQRVRHQKALKILSDISNAIFKQQFIRCLIVPQDPFNISGMKDVFSRLAHSSIMKLDQNSMDKLFFLMLMSVKKEIFLLSSPLELYSLTVCHLMNIAKYLDGSDTVLTINKTLQYFRSVALKYSFMQYVQIREFILSDIENHQTKIVNFIQANYQTSTGKLIFRLRNGHNQKSIGSGMNQKDIQFPTINPQNTLFYQNWSSWKNNLVIDYVEDYKKSSDRRNSTLLNSTSSSVKPRQQKSLKDILNIKTQNLDQFQVTFDIFQNQAKSNINHSDIQEKLSQGNSKVIQSNMKPNNSFKNKIQKQFSDLKIDTSKNEEEQPDLLDMMDN